MEIRSPSLTGVMQAMMIIPVVVVRVAELLDRALAAGAHRAEGRVPAEVGEVVAEIEDRLKQILALSNLVLLTVDENGNHQPNT